MKNTFIFFLAVCSFLYFGFPSTNLWSAENDEDGSEVIELTQEQVVTVVFAGVLVVGALILKLMLLNTVATLWDPDIQTF